MYVQSWKNNVKGKQIASSALASIHFHHLNRREGILQDCIERDPKQALFLAAINMRV